MNSFLDETQAQLPPNWKKRIKAEAWQKTFASTLMHGCGTGDIVYIKALLGGFWYFVSEFPWIIRRAYSEVPHTANENVQRFLKRSAKILSGTLQGMEEDERAHRTLWIRSASCVGLLEDDLAQWEVLPETRKLTDAIGTEASFERKLLYFVAVEIVAEGISRCLIAAPRFSEVMGTQGMGWFNAHVVEEDDATTHEAVAYNLAFSLKRVANEPLNEAGVNADVQRCVDWFIDGAIACVERLDYRGG